MIPIKLNPREYGLPHSTDAGSITFETTQGHTDINRSHEVRISLDAKTTETVTNPNIKSYHPLEDPSHPITRRRASITKAE